MNFLMKPRKTFKKLYKFSFYMNWGWGGAARILWKNLRFLIENIQKYRKKTQKIFHFVYVLPEIFPRFRGACLGCTTFLGQGAVAPSVPDNFRNPSKIWHEKPKTFKFKWKQALENRHEKLKICRILEVWFVALWALKIFQKFQRKDLSKI